MKKKNFLIDKIKKYFQNQYLTINKKKQDKNNIESISRTFLASLLIISFFSISPIIIQFMQNASLTSSDFENNSKNNLKKLLEQKDIESNKVTNKNFLFEDILMFNERPTTSVRLSAATIEELFKSTNYTLDDVRKNKLVKPIALTLLPDEIKKIENI